MSKHFKNLRQFQKATLGLNTKNISSEITTQESKRSDLSTSIYTQSQTVIGAEILKEFVDTYHLKTNASVISDFRTRTLAEIESATVRSTIDTQGTNFSNENTDNFDSFDTNATTYGNKSLDLFVYNLLEKGDLTIESVTSGSSSGSGTFLLTGGGTEEGGTVGNILVGETTIYGETIITEPGQSLSDTATSLIQAINISDNNISLGISAAVTSVDESSVTITVSFTNVSDYIGQAFAGTTTGDIGFEPGDSVAGGSTTIITDETKVAFNKVVTDYIPTFESLYIQYLPSFMVYQSSLTTALNDYKIIDGEDGVQLLKTKELLDTFSAYTEESVTKEVKSTLSGGFTNSISSSVVNLKKEQDTSNTIIKTYGLENLNDEKEKLDELESDYDTIDNLIINLESQKTAIENNITNKTKASEEVEATIGSLDINFITGNTLINIISATSAHTETLKVYSGSRINDLILNAISDGKFEIEVSDLTNIEAKILLDNGYEVIESFDRKKFGNFVKNVVTFTIRWSNANVGMSEG